MFVRKSVLSFLFLTLCLKAFPAVFTVTSNADSGPGTLRDALTQAAANGSATQDIIQFNLADLSVAGRTILLQSQLPDLSSNLVIDGTTQAGAVFGQSNAHIKISTPNNNIGIILFTGTNLNDVEFYGLYLYDSTDSAYPHPNLGVRLGINITHSTNIIIGDVNKGNLIKGFAGYGVYLYYTNAISVKANIFGLTDNTDLSEGQSASDHFLNCNNITLGGQTLPEGNTFFNEIDLDFEPNSNINVIIGSNNFGVIKNVATNQNFVASAFAYMRINTYGLQEYGATPAELANAASVNMTIVNNLAFNTDNLFRINSFKGLINVTKNYVGIDRDGVTVINGLSEYSTYAGVPFFISNCSAQINIGANDPSQENFIAYSLYAITASNSSNIYVRKNEYQCLAGTPYLNDNVNNSLPKISITSTNSVNGQTSIAGASAPGALIDIYSSESCTYSHCSIRKYIGTVIADGNGQWQSGLFNLSGIFYVSSTVVNRTSEFKTFEINADKVIVTNLRCNNPGSVTGLIVPAGLTYYWTDQNGNTVSTNLNLTTKIPGKYQLHLQGGCITSNVYEIDDERLVINTNGLITTDPSCGQNNGVIKNINVYDPLNKIKQTLWFDAGGAQIANTINATNLPAGTYTLKVFTTDDCETDYGPISLKNATGPNIDPSQVIITPSGCGQANGSITNLKITSSSSIKYSWTNTATRQEVAVTADLLNQSAGSYLLIVSNADGTCQQQYGPALITNTGGPVIDDSNIKLFDANCNNNGGSITGIKANGNGNLTYTWTNGRGIVVGNSPELTNIGAGAYTLTVTDQGLCGASYSSPYTLIAQTGVALDQTNLKVTPTSCGSYGSVTGLAGDGPLNFVWKDDSGTIVSNTADLFNAVGGIYTLTVSNACGTRSTFTYDLGAKRLQVPVLNGIVTSTCIGIASGSISIQTDPSVKSYRWVDGQGTTIGNVPSISNIAAGSYQLYITYQNGCESFYKTYTVPEIARLQLVQGSAQITDDQCALKTGSIKNIQVTGGTAPYNFTWANAAGQTISTSADISGLGSGDYTLTVTDVSNCNIAANRYTIHETESVIPAPTANNVEVCSSGDTFLTVNNPSSPFTYRLYDDQNSSRPLDEENSGRFKVTISNNRSYFISQLKGTCESVRSEVKVTVGISGVNIPNAFTPNGDGINDYWSLKGMENNPNSLVQVFTRYGQKVFESRGYDHPFDGTSGGKELPSGVYYYIINLGTNCNMLSGNVTIIR